MTAFSVRKEAGSGQVRIWADGAELFPGLVLAPGSLDSMVSLRSRNMYEADFEGTLVLEKLAETGRVEEFFDAVDADDFGKAKALLKRAGVDAETIAIVMRKMAAGEEP